MSSPNYHQLDNGGIDDDVMIEQPQNNNTNNNNTMMQAFDIDANDSSSGIAEVTFDSNNNNNDRSGSATSDTNNNDNNKQQQQNAEPTNDNDDDDDDGGNDLDDDANETEEEREKRHLKEEQEWTYQPPPNNKKTFEFYEDESSTKLFCRFSSEFCSGNVTNVIRTGKSTFDLYVANDCMGGPHPVGNKMWFYFAVTGVPHGTTLTFTLQQVPFVKTYTYGYTPVVAVDPPPSSSVSAIETLMNKTIIKNENNTNKKFERSPEEKKQSGNNTTAKSCNQSSSSSEYSASYLLPSKNFTRISGPSVTITPAPLPDSVRIAREEKEKQRLLEEARQNAATSQNADGATTTSSPTTTKKKKKEGGNPEYCHISFDYTFDSVLRNAQLSSNTSSFQPQFTYYFAFCHPYSYDKLQRHLSIWSTNFGPKAKAKLMMENNNAAMNNNNNGSSGSPLGPSHSANRELAKQQAKLLHPVMYRELLTKTLDGKRVDLLTITARPAAQIQAKTNMSNNNNNNKSSTTPVKANTTQKSNNSSAFDELFRDSDNDDDNSNSMNNSAAIFGEDREPRFGPEDCLPLLDMETPIPTLQSLADMAATSGKSKNDSTSTTSTPLPPPSNKYRPLPNLTTAFPPHRKFVLLSARVHPGEVPASHVMHGVIEFLLNTEDPRAHALRENFIFVIVPMINPDGVSRGHTRADTVGCNLNRMYKTPSPKKHPTVWALRQVMLHLSNHSSNRGLALYVDMHAHANKRGSFFYGNALDAKKQVENLLFAKLVSLNSPYLMFNDCNYTQANMYSMGKTGVCRDGSSRVTAWLEMGVVNSYTLECNSMVGPTGGSNGVVGLGSSSSSAVGNNSSGTNNSPSSFGGSSLVGKVAAVELEDRAQGAPSPRYTPQLVYHDIGKSMMVSLLDMFQLNPISRLSLLPEYRNITGVRNFLAAAIYNDAVEQSRKKKLMASARGGTTSSTMTTTNDEVVVLVTKEDREKEKERKKKLALQQQQQQAEAENAQQAVVNSSPAALSSNTNTNTKQDNNRDPFLYAGPVNSIIGPRALIPPTTTTCNIYELQQAAQQYQQKQTIPGATSSSATKQRKSALPPPHMRRRLSASSSNNNTDSTPSSSLPSTPISAVAVAAGGRMMNNSSNISTIRSGSNPGGAMKQRRTSSETKNKSGSTTTMRKKSSFQL